MTAKSSHLTAKQIAIIETTIPRVIVSAVAGSGKTKTLCARISHLGERDVLAGEILALSFSTKAVGILRERLGNDSIKTMTFHAFGQEVVSARAAQQGQRAPSFLDPKDSDALLRSAIAACPKACRFVLDTTGIRLRSSKERKRLGAFFNRIQGSDELARAVAFSADSGFSSYRPVLRALREIRLRYEREIDDNGSIDYAGMLRQGGELLSTGAARLPYRYLFIDEAQDLSMEQAQLLAAIAKQVPHVMAFGDPHQSVFSFMGGHFRHLQDALGDVVTLSLSHSFRLSPETAALASSIMDLKKQPIIGNGAGEKPVLFRCQTAAGQENEIVRLIQNLKRQGVAGDRIAILARTKMQLRDVEQALRAAAHETMPMYRQRLPEHTDRLLYLLAFIEKWKWAIVSPHRKRWIEKRLCDITGRTVSRAVLMHCRRMLAGAIGASSPGGRYVAASRIYLRLVTAAGAKRSAVAAELERWEAISRKFRKVDALRAHIAALSEQAPIATSTIHGAKGDEWDHVIVLGVTEGSLPLHYAIKSGKIAEERRLFYVAVTRARKRAYLFQAPYHHAPSRRTFTEASSFLTERVMQTLAAGAHNNDPDRVQEVTACAGAKIENTVRMPGPCDTRRSRSMPTSLP